MKHIICKRSLANRSSNSSPICYLIAGTLSRFAQNKLPNFKHSEMAISVKWNAETTFTVQMCVNYKISQNPPKMLELAVEHLAAFSEILDDFQVLASLKWNEILWVIFEVWDQTQWVLGPQDTFKEHLEISNFRVLHIVKLAVCRTCVVQPKTEYLGHWAVVHWHSVQDVHWHSGPKHQHSGPVQRGPVSKILSLRLHHTSAPAEGPSVQVHRHMGQIQLVHSVHEMCRGRVLPSALAEWPPRCKTEYGNHLQLPPAPAPH